ncbi:MAG: RAMP superfamily CRISPR-associated protein, partial [Phormidesmis sp.]
MADWKDALFQYKVEELGDNTPVEDSDHDEHELWAAAATTGKSPLQKLIFAACQTDDERTDALKKTAYEEKSSCDSLYKALTARTESLADKTVSATFPWRLKVGGLRGFQELLLPAFHPVYGIPYVPSSSLKGMLKGWAKKALPEESEKIREIFGYLEGEESATARVQILDAFPTKPCLSTDIANPQWHWDSNQQVKYKPEPHPMLSMRDVTLVIGLKRTSLGRAEDVITACTWLEKALLTEGLGGRVSAGYGRAQKVNKKQRTASSPRYVASTHPFELWSEGMYGISTKDPEFRTVSVRGILRYWFRAFALGLYSPQACQALENNFFGSLEVPEGDEKK